MNFKRRSWISMGVIFQTGVLLAMLVPLRAVVASMPVVPGVICEDCSAAQYYACARQMGTIIPYDEPHIVWVVDFVRENANKYALVRHNHGWQGESAGSRDVPKDPDDIALSSSENVFVTPQVLNGAEIAYVDDLFDLVNNVLRPIGSGQPLYTCQVGPQGEVGDQWLISTGDASTIASGAPPVVEPVPAPPGAPPSAYDVMGNFSLGVSIGNQLSSSRPLMSRLLSLATALGDLLNIPVNMQSAFVIEFDDGSYGLWIINYVVGSWVPDFDEFYDSDHNPIPMTIADTQGRFYDFPGGVSNPNFQRLNNRVALFTEQICWVEPISWDGQRLTARVHSQSY